MKRFIDLFIAITGLVMLAPILITITLFTRILIGAPIFYTQQRPGLKGKIFKIYKFRTMTNDRDCDGNLLPSDKRITWFGKILRKSSMDELPELINVIKGDMSIVGPRPLRVEYLEHYSIEQMKRHDIRPGITGWAQINGRNGIEWEEKFELDVWYVNNRSVLLDTKILFITFKKIFMGVNINTSSGTMVQPFKGVKLHG